MIRAWKALKDRFNKALSTHGQCPVCNGASELVAHVDFNKSCEERNGVHLPNAATPIAYHLCPDCGFCFAPAIQNWSIDDFAHRIYNDDYVIVDPDYLNVRPYHSASTLKNMFGAVAGNISHLDYGGGDGLLSSILRQSEWNSQSYDPFVDGEHAIPSNQKFDLITAIEVFEHVPDPRALMCRLSSLLAPDGIVFFTTLLSDGQIYPGQKLNWWYAAPRNGHISLYSKQSLKQLASDHGFEFGSYSEGVHCLWRTKNSWARPILPT